MDRRPVLWFEAEPARAAAEKEAMTSRAPEMEWFQDEAKGLGSGGFEGFAPLWPFDRPKPAGLEKLTAGKQLRARVEYPEGFPAQPPRLFPLDPAPGVDQRLQERFHVNGDGSICLILHPSDWSSDDFAVDLVEKASGWFIEYLAVEVGIISEMSSAGLFASQELDAKLETL